MGSELSESGLVGYDVAISPSVGCAGIDGGHSVDVGGCGGAGDNRKGGRGGDGVGSCGDGADGGTERAKGQATHRSTMGARARQLSHGAHAGAITQGGTCIRGKGTSGGPDSCWGASKGAAGDAGIEGDEGPTAS